MGRGAAWSSLSAPQWNQAKAQEQSFASPLAVLAKGLRPGGRRRGFLQSSSGPVLAGPPPGWDPGLSSWWGLHGFLTAPPPAAPIRPPPAGSGVHSCTPGWQERLSTVEHVLQFHPGKGAGLAEPQKA